MTQINVFSGIVVLVSRSTLDTLPPFIRMLNYFVG